MYKFFVEVSEGAPGFSDVDDYFSYDYETFEGAYRGLISFKPHKRWRHFRMISRMGIQKKGNPMVNVDYWGGYAIAIDALNFLDVTEETFDRIIEKIESG